MEQNNNRKETFAAIVMANALQISANGKESVGIQVQTISNLATGEEVEKRFVGNLWLTPAAVDGTIKTLREVFDYKEYSFRPLNDPQLLKGKEVEISVEYELYNGQERASIRWFNKPGSFANRGIKPIDNVRAEDLCSRLDGYFVNAEQDNGNPYATETQRRADLRRQQASSAEGSDLPF